MELVRRDLLTLPFRHYEMLRGLVDGETGRVRWLPLVGFEADTPFRKWALRGLNRVNVALARSTGRPLRISINPGDLDDLLGGELERLQGEPWRFVEELP